MRKNIFLITAIAILLVISGSAAAQSTKTGIRIGLNMADISSENVISTKKLTGITAGAFVTFNVGPLKIQPELLYSQKGAKLKIYDSSGIIIVDEDLKLSYIEIPLLVKYDISSINTSIFAGPSFSYLIGAKAGDEDIEDSLKESDTGIVIGAGIDLSTKLSIDGRYTLSLNDCADNYALDLKNSVITVNLGIIL